MSEWISVKDRVPKQGEKILCWCENKKSFFDGWMLCGSADRFAIYAGSATDANVTHWKYIEPPENQQ